jgi:hypothetical protein
MTAPVIRTRLAPVASDRASRSLVLLAGVTPPCPRSRSPSGLVTGWFATTPSPEAKENRVPSMALDEPRERRSAPPPAGFAVDGRVLHRHLCHLHGDERFVSTIEIEPGTSLYGTGQAAGPLLRNGRGSPSAGTSTPTATRTLGDLTGTIEMPPKWAVGYHQCRYSYYPDAACSRSPGVPRPGSIPADVIWMDIDYMDGFRSSPGTRGFPDPAGLNAYLDAIGFSNVWMIDPGVANEEGYFVPSRATRTMCGCRPADRRSTPATSGPASASSPTTRTPTSATGGRTSTTTSWRRASTACGTT